MSRSGEARLELLARLLWALVVAVAIVLAAHGANDGDASGARMINNFNAGGDLTVTSLK